MEKYLICGDFDKKDKEESNIISEDDSRLFYIYGDINTKTCVNIARNIVEINMEDDKRDQKEKNYKREPIRIHISSYGGAIYAMWLLIDVMETSTTPVWTYCNGYCMSAAFLIFIAGHKRFVNRHSTLMYHQYSGWNVGKYQDMVDDREHDDYLNAQMEEYVQERTRLTSEELEQIRLKKKDQYFTAKEALQFGIADEMLGGKCKADKADGEVKRGKAKKDAK